MVLVGAIGIRLRPSMKVPPKRKGNNGALLGLLFLDLPSMKVPPKRKGNEVQVRRVIQSDSPPQ